MAARKRDLQLNDTLDSLDKKIEQCRVLYELWFNGVEKREPVWHRQDINRQITVLQRNMQEIASPVDRFRFRNIQARFNTLNQYWNRVCLQRDRGNYHKDLARMRRRMGDLEIRLGAALEEKEARRQGEQGEGMYALEEPEGGASSLEEAAQQAALSGASPGVAGGSSGTVPGPTASTPGTPSAGGVPSTGRPAVATQGSSATRPGDAVVASRAPTGGQASATGQAQQDKISDQRMQQLYRTYLKAREQTQESTNVSFEAVARSIEQQIPKLREKGYDNVDFRVVIVNGKAAIRPVTQKKEE